MRSDVWIATRYIRVRETGFHSHFNVRVGVRNAMAMAMAVLRPCKRVIRIIWRQRLISGNGVVEAL